MNLPPFALGAAALFWGWQAGLPAAGVLLAVLLEGRRLYSPRLGLSPEHYAGVSDLSAMVFLGSAVYAYATSDPSRAFLRLSIWQPLFFAPLTAAQFYSVEGKLPLSAFFIFLRKGDHEWSRVTVDIAPALFAMCLLAAGASNVRTDAYYAGLILLMGWALWPTKPAAAGRAVWACLFAAAAALGYAGQLGLHRLQSALERRAVEFVFGVTRPDINPDRTATAIGHIGSLKLSDAVVLRVQAAGRVPPLLRVASYNSYRGLRWDARHSALENVRRSGDSWPLAAPTEPAAAAVVSLSFPKGEGVLPLPAGAFRVEGLPVGGVYRTRLGAVKAEEAPGAASYRVLFGAGAPRDGPPDVDDLQLPAHHRDLFKAVAEELRLDAEDPRGALAKVEGYFAEGFSYSLYRDEGDPRVDPLTEFMVKTRTGHCEHFATAAAMLLRAAGIPARYAAGYALVEFSRLENAYVARGRHAHAWTLARTPEGWVELDATPASWAELESARAAWYAPAADLGSWVSFRLSRWWWGPEGRRERVLWLLLALGASFIAWRLLKDLSAPAVLGAPPAATEGPRPGLDSEFYAVEARLAERGLGRRPWETAGAWVERIAASDKDLPLEPLRAASTLHSRYRFDPKGLDPASREELRASVARCVAALAGRSPAVPALDGAAGGAGLARP